MTEDPSAGYIVKGYYADEDITDNPEGLKRIGNMKQQRDYLFYHQNDTINGEPSNIDEGFLLPVIKILKSSTSYTSVIRM